MTFNFVERIILTKVEQIFKCYCNNCNNTNECTSSITCFTTVYFELKFIKKIKIIRSCINNNIPSADLALFCNYNLYKSNQFTKCCNSGNFCNSEEKMTIKNVLTLGNIFKIKCQNRRLSKK